MHIKDHTKIITFTGHTYFVLRGLFFSFYAMLVVAIALILLTAFNEYVHANKTKPANIQELLILPIMYAAVTTMFIVTTS